LPATPAQSGGRSEVEIFILEHQPGRDFPAVGGADFHVRDFARHSIFVPDGICIVRPRS
jgi:hypothetical protein